MKLYLLIVSVLVVSGMAIAVGFAEETNKVVVIPLVQEVPAALTPDQIRQICRSYESLGYTPPSEYECPPKLVFVTHAKFGADLGGVAGADFKCWGQAMLSPLTAGREWKAWISESQYNCPYVTFIRSKTRYELVDGTKIADNFQDLIDGNLDNPILKNQYNELYYGWVWTGTNAGGLWISNGHCDGWTSAEASAGGGYAGYNNYFDDFKWTAYSNIGCETDELPIYCFEQ